MLRTLVDEKLEAAALMTRLNIQVCRHAPGSRFITLFYAVFEPLTGALTYVSAGHMPPLVLRRDGTCERLSDGGIALGMFEGSTYTTGQVVLGPEDLIAVYSDGITEAENPAGKPFDEIGLETALKASARDSLSGTGAAVVRAVERHTDETRFADDLTILLLRRTAPAPAGV
jgi:sigma-B regulation protein RsbU (phosphoserine phosphatase)